MKTIFTIEEIEAFILKEKDLIVGDEAIAKAIHRPQEGEGINMKDAIDRIYKIGTDHGHIMGRIELMYKLMDFFQIELNKD